VGKSRARPSALLLSRLHSMMVRHHRLCDESKCLRNAASPCSCSYTRGASGDEKSWISAPGRVFLLPPVPARRFLHCSFANVQRKMQADARKAAFFAAPAATHRTAWLITGFRQVEPCAVEVLDSLSTVQQLAVEARGHNEFLDQDVFVCLSPASMKCDMDASISSISHEFLCNCRKCRGYCSR